MGVRIARRICWIISLLLCFAVALRYANRWDAGAAVTVFPNWCWLLPGISLWIFGRTRRRALWWLPGLLWLVFGLTWFDDPRSLTRWSSVLDRKVPAQRAGRTVLRVISLNCGSAGPAAAREVQRYRPDVVLLQEAPAREDLERLAADMFGQSAVSIWSNDTAILARGRMQQLSLDAADRDYFTAADVTLDRGHRLVVVSLRLEPNMVRLDLWNPRCWSDQAAIRRRQRVQLAKRSRPCSIDSMAGP